MGFHSRAIQWRNHLCGKLHTAAPEGELLRGFRRQPPQSAVKIHNVRMETLSRQPGEHPYAPDMASGHRTLFKSAGKVVPDD